MTDEQLGHVIEIEAGEDAITVTVCTDCYDDSRHISLADVSDDDVYGDEVPYPECYCCGAVMRP